MYCSKCGSLFLGTLATTGSFFTVSSPPALGPSSCLVLDASDVVVDAGLFVVDVSCFDVVGWLELETMCFAKDYLKTSSRGLTQVPGAQ